MSSFGSQIRKRLAELNNAGKDITRIIAEVAEGATIEAVRVATEHTPPNGGAAIAGANARSGDLAQHWTTDSVTTPVNGKTLLANNMQYASYVDQGHRVDKHFVPHLHEAGGMLSYDPGYDGGITVGTKTTYVPGLYMTKKATGAYRNTVRKELDKRVREAFK